VLGHCLSASERKEAGKDDTAGEFRKWRSGVRQTSVCRGFGKGSMAEISDKLKFVGHF
jgi:hypothetical protein